MTSWICSLRPHPAARVALPDDAITVEVRYLSTQKNLEISYDIRSEHLPVLQPLAGPEPVRCDDLWRHTCCELFIAPTSGKGRYIEFNFAPSGDWAAYEFEGLRRGMRPLRWSGNASNEGDAGCAAPTIRRYSSIVDDLSLSQRLSLHRLQVEVQLPAPPIIDEIRLSPTVVLETSAGISHWALRHPHDQPDFHDPTGFGEPLNFYRSHSA